MKRGGDMPRQTIYERDGWDEKLELIEGWARDGLTNEQIATKMGISHETLYQYQKKYPEFYESLKANKEVADRKVEKALYNKALEGNNTAMIFWLKNRKPTVWRDRKDIQANITDERKDMTEKERKERLQELRTKLGDD